MLMRLVRRGSDIMNRNNLIYDEFISKINKENRLERISVFIWGVLIYAISFSIFFSPRNIVTGGTTGMSLLVKEMFHVDTEIFVFVCSLIILIFGYLMLGKEVIIKTLFGL